MYKRQQQDKLLITERYEAWETVARKLAHEIKNPLTPIQLSIDSLREKYKKNFNYFNLSQKADLKEAADQFIKRTERRPFSDKGGQFLWYWASIYNEGDHHGSHNHPNSLIAGTYYPQTSAESSSIMLESPWDSFIMHDTMPGEKIVFNYKPNAGDMIMWPSWIKHRVDPQPKTEVPRIAISFNFDYANYHD